MSATVRSLVAALDREFPFAWAEPWDKVGLLAGDFDARVAGVLVTLDATPGSIEQCRRSGANVVLTHHPAFLTPPASLRPGAGPGGIVFEAVRCGVALIACHTNLDRAPAGAASLGRALGLPEGPPLERDLQPVKIVTVFVPADAAGLREVVVRAMADAGAGRIGNYEDCMFSASGVGGFVPLSGARPFVAASAEEMAVTGPGGGVPGSREVAEDRIEMVCAPDDCERVVEAARGAHPYEEPLIVCADGDIARGAARLGRVCDLTPGRTLGELASAAANRMGSTPRVWGDRDREILRVATATGSAGGLLSDALASGADALVAGEVRYHDALNAVASGLAIIELGHDVSEWPLVPILGSAVRTFDHDIAVEVQAPQPRWWTP